MTIICKICGQEFSEFIHWTHLKKHGLTSKQYQLLHGPVAVPGRTISDERKAKISASVSKYGTDNPEIMKARTKKAIQTKVSSGYDFGSSMRGKTQTDYAKDIARKTMTQTNQKRKDRSFEEAVMKLTEMKISIEKIEHPLVTLNCGVCGTAFNFTYQYLMPSKFKKTLCPTCNPRSKPVSNKEQLLFEFVTSICPDAIQSYRTSYHSKELDIFIPSLNLGIEFNGLYWHSEEVAISNNKSPKHLYEKMKLFKTQGINIINVFEDEWDNKNGIVKSRLQNILKRTNRRLWARKCMVKKIVSTVANRFCDEMHIMGGGRSNVNYGLYFDDELVSVMTFTKSNISRKLVGWELNRFCSKLNTTVVGGANKLLSAFIKEYSPEEIISYSDNRWSDGELYSTLGFDKASDGIPNYWYTKDNTSMRIHRFSLRKNKNDPKDITERQLRLEQGYHIIWDCGSAKWIWKNPGGIKSGS